MMHSFISWHLSIGQEKYLNRYIALEIHVLDKG